VRHRLDAPLRETNPISGSPSVLGGRNAQNKAKPGQTGASGRRRVWVCLLCETKPISRLRISGTAPGNRRPPSAELSDCGLRIGDKPAAFGLPLGRLSKQTQFKESRMRAKSLIGQRLWSLRVTARLGKTKPISKAVAGDSRLTGCGGMGSNRLRLGRLAQLVRAHGSHP
jgi:hypothetical protein